MTLILRSDYIKIGNLFLKLKHRQEPQTLKVDTLAVLPPQAFEGRDLAAGGATLRKIRLTYHLSGDAKQRAFEGGLVEQPATPGKKETLLVSYSPEGKFDEKLLRDFFHYVHVKSR